MSSQPLSRGQSCPTRWIGRDGRAALVRGLVLLAEIKVLVGWGLAREHGEHEPGELARAAHLPPALRARRRTGGNHVPMAASQTHPGAGGGPAAAPKARAISG